MKKLQASLIAIALALPGLALAESQTVNPAAGGSTATGKLDFKVVIPAVLYLRVGTGNSIAGVNNTTVDKVTFDVPAANIGDSTVVDGSFGDLGNGEVTVRVFSNVGTNVTLNSATTGRLSNGTDLIPWTAITVAAAADPAPLTGWTNTGITHPTFNNAIAGGNSASVTLTASSKIVRQQGKWTFKYANDTVYPAGTYGDTAANNGRVTYTATQL